MAEIIKEGEQITVKPGKDIVASMADEFRGELSELTKQSPQSIIMDLEGVDMIDSIGLGVLIATHNSLLKTGGKLRLIHVSRDILGLLTTMRLDKHFEVVGD